MKEYTQNANPHFSYREQIEGKMNENYYLRQFYIPF
jgi:hypothetical protein